MALAGSYDLIDTTNVRTYSVGGGADAETFVRVQGETYDGSYEFVRDFQGTILALVDRSDQAVVERYRYSPFGEVTIYDSTGVVKSESQYGNERLFLGRLWDAEVGIYDVRNRWYEPDRGAFLAPDPLGAVDSWNLYQYGFGTSARWSDASGLQSGGGGAWTTIRFQGGNYAVDGEGAVREFADGLVEPFGMGEGRVVEDPGLADSVREAWDATQAEAEAESDFNLASENFRAGVAVLLEVFKNDGPKAILLLGEIYAGNCAGAAAMHLLASTAHMIKAWRTLQAARRATSGALGLADDIAKGANAAYDVAAAGGRHAGTLRNYAGRSGAEIQKAIRGYEKQVALHEQKLANPAQFAENWGSMPAREQAGLLNKWEDDVARNQELANVLRGLVGVR